MKIFLFFPLMASLTACGSGPKNRGFDGLVPEVTVVEQAYYVCTASTLSSTCQLSLFTDESILSGCAYGEENTMVLMEWPEGFLSQKQLAMLPSDKILSCDGFISAAGNFKITLSIRDARSLPLIEAYVGASKDILLSARDNLSSSGMTFTPIHVENSNRRLNGSSETLGSCYSESAYSSQNYMLIYAKSFEKELAKLSTGNAGKYLMSMALLAHEMGHCIKDRPHVQSGLMAVTLPNYSANASGFTSLTNEIAAIFPEIDMSSVRRSSIALYPKLGN